MAPLSSLQGIFIDFYGTIAGGDRAAVENCCARVVAGLRLSISAAELARRWGEVFFDFIGRHNGEDFVPLAELENTSLVETIRSLAGPFDPQPYTQDLVAYWRRPPLFPESKKVLQSLPVPVCCVSNVDTADLLAACEYHRLRFTEIVTSENTRSYKPDGAVFEAALHRTGWSSERVIHVGDSLFSDVKGAHDMGIRAAWIKRDDRILDIGEGRPEWTLSDLGGLLRLENL